MKKALFLVRLLVTVTIFAAAVIQICGLYDKAINVAVPLVGFVMLLQGIEHWNISRKSAIADFCVAGFIFVVSMVVFFL